MPALSQASAPADHPEIAASRLIDAPRDCVFDAFSSAGRLARWWGPNGFALTMQEMTFAPDGVWRFVMHGPDGRNYDNKIVFRDISRPERISYVHSGEEGEESLHMEVELSFIEEAGKTRLTLRMRAPTIAERDRIESKYSAMEGGKETLARLDAFVAEAGAQAFEISRSFPATPERLWKALAEQEQLAKWWGPKGCPVVAAKLDFRPGGHYHYGLGMPDGEVMWARFVYRETVEPSRIVLVSSFSNEEGGLAHHAMSPTWPLEMISVFSLEAEGERTKLTIRWQPIDATDEERATFVGMTASMQQGWGGTLDQLGEYLASQYRHRVNPAAA